MSTKRSCSLSDCHEPVRARGYCAKHYQRWKKHGDPSVSRQGQRPSRDPWDRFMEKVEIRDGCWLWTKALFKDTGYAAFRVGNRQWRAHVWAWEQRNGDRPRRNGKPLPLDHFVCSTSRCVNPDHVRPVTDRENVLRSNSLQAQNRAKTHCPAGHEYDEQNTYVDPRGSRNCRTCMNTKRRRYR